MVGLKDYYPATPDLAIQGCPPSDVFARAAYVETLNRLQAIGTDTIWIYNYGDWDDFSKDVWTMTSNLQIPDETIKFVIAEAHKRNIKVFLGWQFGSIDVAKKVALPMIGMGESEIPYPQIVKMLNSWRGLMLNKAKLYGDAGLDGLQIDFHAFFVGVQPSYKEYYLMNMLTLISDVKKVFPGKISYGGAMPGIDARFVNKVDLYEVPDLSGIDRSYLKPLTVAKLKEAYVADMTNAISAVPTGIPIMISSLVQSKRDFYDTHWTEDGFCVNANGGMTTLQSQCVQMNYFTDFSLQAMGIEAMLQATNQIGATKISAINFNTGYWLTDNLTAYPSFPNLSQSFRNKPAEKIVQKWFAK